MLLSHSLIVVAAFSSSAYAQPQGRKQPTPDIHFVGPNSTSTTNATANGPASVKQRCNLHVSQWTNYCDMGLRGTESLSEVKLVLQGPSGKTIVESGKEPSRMDSKQSIRLDGDVFFGGLRIMKDSDSSDILTFEYNGDRTWTSREKEGGAGPGWCKVGDYDRAPGCYRYRQPDGKREMDCNFECDVKPTA